MAKFKVGDKVKMISRHPRYGRGEVSFGEVGEVGEVGEDSEDGSYWVDFPSQSEWRAGKDDIELVDKLRKLQVGDLVERLNYDHCDMLKGEFGFVEKVSDDGESIRIKGFGAIHHAENLRLVTTVDQGTPQAIIDSANTILSLTKETEMTLDEAVNICKNTATEIAAIEARIEVAQNVMKAAGIRLI